MKGAYAFFAAALALTVVSTFLLVVYLVDPRLGVAGAGVSGTGGSGASYGESALGASSGAVLQLLLKSSPFLATGSWVMLAGGWVWRGRMKARWEGLGLDSGAFDLFVKMRGAPTRMSLLGALSRPKDRLQLAQELGLDWKAVDYHINLLEEFGVIHEDHAYGKVKMYCLTALGRDLLKLLEELNDGKNGAVSKNGVARAATAERPC